MGLEPMTSPLPRECSTTELHQRSCSASSAVLLLPSLCSSPRARILAITTRNAKSPKNKIGSHRISTSRSAIPTYLDEYPRMWITAAGSIVNHDSNPKTTKTPRAIYMRRLSAAGLSDRSLSPIVIAPNLYYSLLTLYCFKKNGAQGRIRTFVAHNAADLQSAAINHSATCAQASPIVFPATHRFRNPSSRDPARNLLPELSMANAARGNNWQVQPTSFPSTAPQISGAGEGI